MNKSIISIIVSMIIFGTIGLFVRFLSMPSSVIALMRASIGALFLLVIMLSSKKRPDIGEIKKNIAPLLVSGVLLGLNWILLFESYKYTSVATATLCYYMAPIITILVSPFLLSEKLTSKKIICVGFALIGMVLVSGIYKTGIGTDGGEGDTRGVLLGLCAAVFYASVIMTNKKLGALTSFDRTLSQLFIAAAVLVPYTVLTGAFTGINWDGSNIVWIIVVGIVHTGIAYILYFGGMGGCSAGTAAMLGYIDPAVALMISMFILGEEMSGLGILGAVLILGSTILSEIDIKKKSR